MKHLITGVDNDSIAEELGVSSGCFLVSVNDEDIVDVIDYEQLTSNERLKVCFETSDGEVVEADIEKDMYEPLGLNFESGLMSPLRSCKNHCLFCFIDQMPKGVRDSLHVKDDDWRLSLIMGNYVTLTNTDDAEFSRIIKRHVSPLYISVHSTEPSLRVSMMRNPTAALICERLRALYDAKISFNAQIVLCPEINDGEHLVKTLGDLYALRPYAQSVAVVPVGLTRHRNGLYPLRTLTQGEAGAAIDAIDKLNETAVREHGEAFAFASDEMYIAAGRVLPPYESYGDFPQLENGVGLLRKFEREFCDALKDARPLKKRVVVDGASGMSAFGFMSELFKKLDKINIELKLHAIRNDYFGERVTVSGLVTATDIVSQLKGKLVGNALIIPDDMLREREDVFLDGKKLCELKDELGVKVLPLCASDGEVFLNELIENIKEV